MAEGMTASDVALMARDGNDGWGSGMGFMWVFALLILAMGGNGFGWGNNSFNNAIGFENPATSNEVQRGFDNQNSMANQREILAAVNDGTAQAVAATNQTFHDNLMATQNLYNELQRDVAANAVTLANLQAHQQQCCCDTLRAIDGVNYNNAMNTAAINANTTEQTQRILDAITGNEMQHMRDQIQALQTAQMLNPIENRLSMVPTYPNTFSYNAGNNPFCPSCC